MTRLAIRDANREDVEHPFFAAKLADTLDVGIEPVVPRSSRVAGKSIEVGGLEPMIENQLHFGRDGLPFALQRGRDLEILRPRPGVVLLARPQEPEKAALRRLAAVAVDRRLGLGGSRGGRRGRRGGQRELGEGRNGRRDSQGEAEKDPSRQPRPRPDGHPAGS